ncbi:hypothetical protein [Aeromonas cavernicola]|uniref:Uncharacterized protein n=1 Tax=Aeromonas cavernicola TaxID=1006623 RepID=A0A2H9U425_9GAMM|nr:hypothetical protein [Aeromonas cavernicola]PJG58785.1 hypothetical protein CUC53_10765 [Aeromonas cavernicola]
MSINVTLPPLIPNQLHPQVEAARRENKQAELIPQPSQGQSSSGESQIGAQQDRPRASEWLFMAPHAQASSKSHSSLVDSAEKDKQRKKQQESNQQGQSKKHGRSRQSSWGPDNEQYSFNPRALSQRQDGIYSDGLAAQAADPVLSDNAVLVTAASGALFQDATLESGTERNLTASMGQPPSSDDQQSTASNVMNEGMISAYMQLRNTAISTRYQQKAQSIDVPQLNLIA